MNEQFQVKFQIGSYEDEVRCDIIEMDACHILLGRHRKFDRNVVHEGKKNVYSFDMNGHRHSLHPLRGQKEKFSDKNQLIMLNEKEFLEESRIT